MYSRGTDSSAVVWRPCARMHAAVLSMRAGKYTWGDEGSNECPAGSARIVAAAVCERAAVDSGKTWGGTEDNPLFPVGCYWQTSSVYGFLNTNAVGAAYPNARLLCAVGSGARPNRTPIGALKGPLLRPHARRCICVYAWKTAAVAVILSLRALVRSRLCVRAVCMHGPLHACVAAVRWHGCGRFTRPPRPWHLRTCTVDAVTLSAMPQISMRRPGWRCIGMRDTLPYLSFVVRLL